MSNQQSNSSHPLDRVLGDFEEDLKLIATYNTLERQEASRAVTYDLARKAIEVVYLPREQVEAATNDTMLVKDNSDPSVWGEDYKSHHNSVVEAQSSLLKRVRSKLGLHVRPRQSRKRQS